MVDSRVKAQSSKFKIRNQKIREWEEWDQWDAGDDVGKGKLKIGNLRFQRSSLGGFTVQSSKRKLVEFNISVSGWHGQRDAAGMGSGATAGICTSENGR